MNDNPQKRFLCVNMDECTGCRSCELACSYHFERCFNPEVSAIKVVRDDNTGEIDLTINSRCDLCIEEDFPFCVKYCAAEALKMYYGLGSLAGRKEIV